VMVNLIIDRLLQDLKIHYQHCIFPLLSSWKGPARVRRFLWKLVCEALFTNEMRVMKNICKTDTKSLLQIED